MLLPSIDPTLLGSSLFLQPNKLFLFMHHNITYHHDTYCVLVFVTALTPFPEHGIELTLGHGGTTSAVH